MNRQRLAQYTHCYASVLQPNNSRYLRELITYISRPLEEDIGGDDSTTALVFSKESKTHAYVLAKEAGILAGVQEITWLLERERKIKYAWNARDGESIQKGKRILSLAGPARDILKTERILLNVLGRMSGVATYTSQLIEKVRPHAPHILITPTRKTLWGMLDKRAAVLGGGGTHRLSLDDAILIKHNHLRASGISSETYLKRIELKLRRSRARFVEIEAGTLDDALAAGRFLETHFTLPTAILLDNMTPAQVRAVVNKLRAEGIIKPLLEASGRITSQNILAYAKTGVDILSLGSLTHGAPMLDMSMRIENGHGS